ncbi:ABC transporter permease [Actinomadura rudentiformis]|uniref:ABC transporter permease n=1 Tax=Actinomadura rudentiformis TaxID=359158 RepID=A0A6H9YTV1_9ACTN|nr:ABC transporter permease [Actinomadura rudentiformis]KAB2351790.1 ABC transporter permease [Actinomadura rudentiformis]
MTAHGISLVARQEIRTRLRTGRWKVLLLVWFVVVNGFALLFRLALESSAGFDWDVEEGVIMFGGVLLAVLVLTLLVTPALSAQTINGDRERGTLATLQVTRLTAGEIALGKLAAAWGTGLVVLGLTLPSLFLPVVEGAIGIGRFVVVVIVVALLVGIVCAISQGWSALLARSITSVLMSYMTVFGLLVVTPLLFTLAVPLTAQPVDGRYRSYSEEHTEYVWWLLAPNPVVILADATPRLPERGVDHIGRSAADADPLGDIGRSVRDARAGDDGDEESVGPVWPYGLGFNLVLAGGAVWVSARRLRAPARTLPEGIRVA